MSKSYVGRKTASSTNYASYAAFPHTEDWNYIHLLLCTKIDSDWIRNSYVRPEMLTLLKKAINKTLWGRHEQCQGIISRADSWHHKTLKWFCTAQKNSTVKRQFAEWERTVSNCTLDRWLIPRIYEKLQDANTPQIF